MIMTDFSASQLSNASSNTASSATSRSAQPVASSSSSLASDDPYRRMDNFDDYETILHRTEEVEAFLTEVSASVSTFVSSKFIVLTILSSCSTKSPCR